MHVVWVIVGTKQSGLAESGLLLQATVDPGCVKTFGSEFDSQNWSKNRAPT
jgi:hypothetical protein